MKPSQIIANLHSVNVGEMDALRAKLREAREACVEIEQAELATKLGEAADALGRADLKTYRKRLETVIARLGHLK